MDRAADKRLRFVAPHLQGRGEAMTDVGREFGISRKTGYKIFDRYKEHGLEALWSRDPAAPRQPVRPQVVTHVLGTFRYPCLRAGHEKGGRSGRI